jgi:hypothetical protein
MQIAILKKEMFDIDRAARIIAVAAIFITVKWKLIENHYF